MAGRDRLIQCYVSALAAAQIFVSVDARGRLKIGKAEPDVGPVVYVAWCDPRAVDLVIEIANTKPIGAEDAERVLLRAAEEVGAELHSDAEMKATAGAAVDRAEAEFARLQKSGHLRELNARYRTYRLERNAAGEKAQSYSRFVWQQRVALVQKMAQLVGTSSRMSAKLKTALAAPPARHDGAAASA